MRSIADMAGPAACPAQSLMFSHSLDPDRTCRLPRPRSRRADAALASKRSGRGYRLIYATLELGVELHDSRIHERQDLCQHNAGDTLRRVDPEVGVGEPGPGQTATAAASGTLLRIDQEA